MGENERGGVRISFSFAAIILILCASLGFVEASVKGAAAGLAAGAGAMLLSAFGLLPLFGQVLYIVLMDRLEGFLLSHVNVGFTCTVAFWVGLAWSLVLSITVLAAVLLDQG